MNKRGIGFGIFLLAIGVLWLLDNLNIIRIDLNIFRALVTLWPLILVVIGINLIFKGNSLIKGLTWVAFLVIIVLYGSFGVKNSSNSDFNFNFESKFGTKTDYTSSKSVEEPMRTGLEKGNLKIDVGAMKLNVSDESDKLFTLKSSGNEINYNIDYNGSGNSADIDINNKNIRVFGSSAANKVDMGLNDRVTWNIKMNTGASDGDFDLSRLKLSSLDIDAGAVNYKIKLGANVPSTDIYLDSGASSFEFAIPSDDVGVRVKMDGALNNTNFTELGFKKEGSAYVSPNYNDAKAKINIDANIGVAKLTISRY